MEKDHPNPTPEQVEKFLSELTALTRKHEVVIWQSTGAIDGMCLDQLITNRSGRYVVDSDNAHLEWR